MNFKSNEVVIIGAVRTHIGSYKGSLKDIKADKLGSIVIKEIIKRSKINFDEIDEVILGQVLTAGCGQNPARQASLNAGIDLILIFIFLLYLRKSLLIDSKDFHLDLLPETQSNY